MQKIIEETSSDSDDIIEAFDRENEPVLRRTDRKHSVHVTPYRKEGSDVFKVLSRRPIHRLPT